MLTISVFMLIIWVIIFYGASFTNIKISKKGLVHIWYMFVIGLSIFAFYAEPSVSDDLYRHYQLIDILRDGGDLRYTYGEYMVVFRVMLWLVSMTDYNGFLPALTVVIWGWAIGRAIWKYLSDNDAYKNSVLLYYIVVIGGCPTFYLISGIRTALVLALCVYAYYLHYQEKHYIRFALIIALTVTIHYVSIVFVGLLLLYEFAKRKNNYKTYLLIFLALVGIAIFTNTDIFINILSRSNILYFAILREKWNSYSGTNAFSSTMLVEYSLRIIMLIILAFSSIIALNDKNINRNENVNTKQEDVSKSIQFSLFLIFAIISMFRINIIFARLSYAIAMLSLPTIDICLKKIGKESRAIYFFVNVGVFSMQAVYMFYAMLNFMEFGGVNIQNVIHGMY